MACIRIVLHGKAAADPRLRTAAAALREQHHTVEVKVTWEAGDAARLTAEAVADARQNHIDCIVAGGGDGTINEVFAAGYAAKLPESCSLGILPLGTANDFAHSAAIPIKDLTAALRSRRYRAEARDRRRPPQRQVIRQCRHRRIRLARDRRNRSEAQAAAGRVGLCHHRHIALCRAVGESGHVSRRGLLVDRALFWRWRSAMAGKRAAAFGSVQTR